MQALLGKLGHDSGKYQKNGLFQYIFITLKMKYSFKVKHRIGRFKPTDLENERSDKAKKLLDGLDIEEAEKVSSGVAIFFAWCIVSLAA